MELLTELRAGITSRNYGPELRLWNYDVTSQSQHQCNNALIQLVTVHENANVLFGHTLNVYKYIIWMHIFTGIMYLMTFNYIFGPF